MFDRLIRHRKRYEPYHPLLDGEGSRSDEREPPMGKLACIADDVEAGRIQLPPRWKLDRPSPGVQVWTMPSGRRYACRTRSATCCRSRPARHRISRGSAAVDAYSCREDLPCPVSGGRGEFGGHVQ